MWFPLPITVMLLIEYQHAPLWDPTPVILVATNQPIFTLLSFVKPEWFYEVITLLTKHEAPKFWEISFATILASVKVLTSACKLGCLCAYLNYLKNISKSGKILWNEIFKFLSEMVSTSICYYIIRCEWHYRMCWAMNLHVESTVMATTKSLKSKIYLLQQNWFFSCTEFTTHLERTEQ